MLSLLMAAMLQPSPAPAAQARMAFGTCLQRVIRARAPDRLAADAFAGEAKRSCAAQEAALLHALVTHDVATGMSRAEAEQGARQAIEDYHTNASETYATTAPN